MRALALLLVLASAGIARADHNQIDVGGGDRALRSSSADALTDQGLGLVRMAYARALDLELVPGLELWIGGATELGSAQGTLFQTMTTSIDTMAFLGTARLRYPLLAHVAATASLELGTARTAVGLDDGTGARVSDSGWGGIGTGALGLDLIALRDAPLVKTFGARIELGYARATSPKLTLRPDGADDGTLHLRMTEASIGRLDLSGPFFTVSFLSQF